MTKIERLEDRVLRRLRNSCRHRKRDAGIALAAALLLGVGTAYVHYRFVPLEETIHRLRSATPSRDVYAPATIRNEIWYAHDMAVLHAKFDRFMLMMGFGIGVLLGAGLARIRSWPGTNEMVIELWDRLDRLERKVGASGPDSA